MLSTQNLNITNIETILDNFFLYNGQAVPKYVYEFLEYSNGHLGNWLTLPTEIAHTQFLTTCFKWDGEVFGGMWDNLKIVNQWLKDDQMEELLGTRIDLKAKEFVGICLFHMQMFKLKKPMTINRALYALSYLYALCDGYIDDPLVDKWSKVILGNKISEWLEGKKETMVTSHIKEEQISYFLEIMEKEFPRKDNPQIYNMVMDLHKTQMKTINISSNKHKQTDNLSKDKKQTKNTGRGSPRRKQLEKAFRLMGLKGIYTSYLILVLIKPDYSSNNSRMACQLGLLSQIIDDLIDLERDRVENNQTYVLLLLNETVYLDVYLIRCFQMIEEVFATHLEFRNALTALLVYVIQKNKSLFSSQFLKIFVSQNYYNEQNNFNTFDQIDPKKLIKKIYRDYSTSNNTLEDVCLAVFNHIRN